MNDDELRALFFDAILERAEEDEEFREWILEDIQRIKDFRTQVPASTNV